MGFFNYESIEEKTNLINKKIYFLSTINMDDELLQPRIPNNYFTKNGYEDNKTKRICFAPSIDKALMALSQKCNNMELYVHIPEDVDEKYIIKPNVKQVPDSKITGEIWITKPVALKCIGKIKVLGDKGLDGHKFKYGNNVAELYDWDWKWIIKYNKDGVAIKESELSSKERDKLKDSEFIQESYFISKDDIYINFDKWGSKNNILYITGISGSGKTTLINKLKDEYNCEVISFDNLLMSYRKNKEYDQYITKYIKTHNVKMTTWDSDDTVYESRKFLDWFNKESKKYGDKLFIIEGFQIFDFYEGWEFKDKPIIIKGTSAIHSWIRKNKRLLENNKYTNKNKINMFFKVLNELISGKTFRDEKELEKFTLDLQKNILNESNILNKKLYHGSIHKLDILQPNAIDIGNKIQKPGWSLFCWDNKDYAYGWTIMQCIKIISDDLKNKGNKDHDLKVLWYLPLNTPCMTKEGIKKLKHYISSYNLQGYVYTIEQPIYKVGIGNDMALPEFTVRNKDIIPTNIDIVELNNKMIDKYIYRMDKDEMDDYKNEIMSPNCTKYNRKLSVFMIKDHKSKIKMKQNIYAAIANGEIKEGDDISNFSESYIIQESAKDRLYKCPYCDYKGTKVDLVSHVEDEHEEMIPKDYTPARVVYNYINKRESGCCKFCKGPTPWNEKTWKYRVICEKKSCKEKASRLAEENLKKATGMTKSQRMSNPDIQNDMLNNRKISGTYNFKGVKKTYVGSYEYKLLEFYDKVLDVSPDEIQTPGPVIEYIYKGQKHQWITDLYYITANLVHDAKDGGDNPNNREMKDYREKQIAKEKAIKEQGKYNYVRVTNNEFEQLLEVLSEIKYAMIDDTVQNKTICKINEMMSACSLNPVIGTGTGEYIINYGVNGSMIGNAFCDNIAMSKIYKYPGKKKPLKKIDESTLEFINLYDYELYKYIGSEEKSLQEIAELIEETGLEYDPNFKKCIDLYTLLEMKQSSIRESLLMQVNIKPSFIVENKLDINHIKEGYVLMENEDGYYIKHNDKRSCYFESIEEIPEEIFKII